MSAVRLGIIGLGGYAGHHHASIAQLEQAGEAKLVCTCDPEPEKFTAAQETWKLRERGVRVFTDYREMLAACHRDLDVVVVPTPIPLHAEMHRTALEHGLAVYLEKPPTLDFVELEEMIARDRTAKHATLVGFNFIVEKPRLALKQRLLAGEFGALREARLGACWARPSTYFVRNSWAGRLLTDEGQLVLDSCFGNAIAHFVHNILFWAGPTDLLSWAQIGRVQAELYRAHAIPGADTFFVEAHATDGVILRFALSHACAGPSTQAESVVCEKATLHYVVGTNAEIRWNDGRVERVALEPFDALAENHRDYFRYLRRETLRPATTLTDSRPFVALNDLAYVSSEWIQDIPETLVARVRNEKEQTEYHDIVGLAAAQSAFLQRGEWPSARGWGRTTPAASVTPADLSRLHATIRTMAGR